MSMKYKVNKEKCKGSAVCISTCPKGAEWDKDGKARIKDSKEIEKCGVELLCPYKAIESIKEDDHVTTK